MLHKFLVPVFGLGVSFIPTIDVILKCAQAGLAIASFVFVCYQIRDLYEKRKARLKTPKTDVIKS